MTENASSSTSTPETPATPAASGGKGGNGAGITSDGDLMRAVYAEMANSKDNDEEETSEEPVEKAAESTEPDKQQEEPAKTEEQPAIPSEETPKATEEEIAQALEEIEAAKKDLLEHRAKFVKDYGALKRKESGINRKSQELKQREEDFAEKQKRFDVQHAEWVEEIKLLATGDSQQKARILQKHAGGQDLADFVTQINESVLGVKSGDRELHSKLDRLEKLLAQRDEEDKQRTVEDEKARQKAAQQAEYERQMQQGYAYVRSQLAVIARQAPQLEYGALADVAKYAGENVAYKLLEGIGQSLAERGHQYAFEDAARSIANECEHFLTRTKQGREYLQGLRQRAGQTAPQTPQTQATGGRQENPGTSLSAAATSAPGPNRSDLSLQEDAIEYMRRLDDDAFTKRFLPRDLHSS